MEFEEKVLRVLRLLGYKVQRNVRINDCQIDIYGEYQTGVITLRLSVECKDHAGTIGIDDINKFAGVVGAARNRGVVDKALFVTTNGYSAHAKAFAQTNGIELTTYSKLSTQLVDFDDYLVRVIAEFEEAPVSKCYIELTGTETEDYETSPEPIFHRPIEKFINQAFSEDGRQKIALLGNFGTGKSTFCRKYAHDLALSCRKNPSARIPLVVNLRDYDSRLHIQQLILNRLVFGYNVNINQNLCQELQRMGKFLFLFDGFDEMTSRVDNDTIREDLFELNRVAEIAENKFVLTCRTHFFRDQIQADVLSDFDVLYIPEWGETELEEYLRLHFGKNWKRSLKVITGTHNLRELAETPLFLEMIVETLPELGHKVRRIELYKAYTNKWILAQKTRKVARLTTTEREQFVTELAMKLFQEGKKTCHHREFIPILKERFEVDDAAQMDYLRTDVQTCAFLTRDSQGNYGFKHRSFMEFFVAQRLSQEIQAVDFKSLSVALLPLEIRSFLIDFLVDGAPAEALKKCLQDENPILRDNVLSLLPRLKISISDTRIDREPSKESDTQIAATFLQGGPDGFAALYARYEKTIKRYVRSLHNPLLKNMEDDIVIETFMSAWKHKDSLMSVSAIQAYLLKIAKNKCVDYLRAKTSQRRGGAQLDLSLDELDETLEPTLPSPESEIIRRRDFMLALSRLSSLEQTIIKGIIGEGKSRLRVAHDVEMSEAQVTMISVDAMNKLKTFLKSSDSL